MYTSVNHGRGRGGEKIGLLRWIAQVAPTVIGPLAVPILVAGNWDGIDGYDGGATSDRSPPIIANA